MYRIFVIICALSICSDSSQKDVKRETFDLDGSSDISPNDGYYIDSYKHLTALEYYPNVCDDYEDEECARDWLKEFHRVKIRNSNRMANVNFRYSSDINKRNRRLRMKFHRRSIKIYGMYKTKVRKFKWRLYESPQLRRIFQLLTPNIESTNLTVSKRLVSISQEINDIYNNGRACFGTCLAKGESGITELYRKEKDYDKLKGFWWSWRNETGRKIKNLFVERMNLENEGARENGYSDSVSFGLQENYDETNFNETIIRLYDEIFPLYQQLHAYVRYCLAKFYPGRFDEEGSIPAHILGDMWAQQWHNIIPIMKQCMNSESKDSIQDQANEALSKISVKQMFQLAEEFYTSIGMYKMTPTFWERSVLTKPPNKVVNCHGSAHDFSNGVDYRILMCAKTNINHFTTAHHEMGHIQYYMAYRNLPKTYRGSANPGFHEAVGDTIGLSVKTPEHLKRVGLIQNIPTSKDFDIEYLLGTALEKVAFLPFSLTMESFLWSVYNGSVPLDSLNRHWWDLRYRFQGVKPPVERTEDDFDPAAKYHMAFGRSYIRYFVSFIHQFEFYEAMCKLSGHSGPLHRCDFYRSKVAGEAMLKMLKKGESQHWRDTLKILTGSREISTKSILRFFEPLFIWLKDTNKKLNIPIGW